MTGRTIIKSLRMEIFGCFRDRKIEFDPGLNQLVGANETGKSTVIKALITTIFEDGTTRKKSIASMSNWEANRSFRMTLEFSVDEKDFTLVRDYGPGHDIMTDSDGITYEGKSIGEKLAVYFSTSSRSLFESIFCFSSDNPDSPESSKGRLQSAIETPVFYGFDRGRADRYLEEEIKRLDNPRAHGPRELDVISDQISCRLQEKSELEKRIETLDKDKQELDDVRDKLREHEDAMAGLDKEIEGALAYQALNDRMVNLEERLQVHLGNYSRAAQVAEDLERIEEELGRFLTPGMEEMLALSKEYNRLNTRVDGSKQEMDSMIARRKKANRGFGIATLILALVCLAYIFRQNGFIESGPVADSLPYTVPLMALIWLSRIVVYLTNFRKKKKATDVFREGVSNLDTFYVKLNNKYNLKAADPIKALEESIQRKQSLEISAENLRNTIDVLSESKGLEHLNRTRQQIETEVAQLNQELAPLTSFASAAGKLADLKEELISRRVRANAMHERSALLAERCSAIETLTQSANQVDQETEILKRKHKGINERLEILKITRLALNRAADQLIEDTFEAYSASSSSFLASLTGGRYDKLRFSREPGRFEVKIGATGQWLEVSDALSSSTRDCIYLALRLAGVALLSAEFSSPIIFDQAETRMDPKRQQAFFDLLKRKAATNQIIYVGLKKTEYLPEAHLIEFEEEKAVHRPSGTV